VFPFHSGTIKTFRGRVVEVEEVQFPFHSGTIKTVRVRGDRGTAYGVSIPLWYD